MWEDIQSESNKCKHRFRNIVRISTKSIDVAKKREDMMSHRKENVSMRAGIEGTNSVLKRTGLNYMQVHGLIKSTIVCGYMAMAQNIKRFFKFQQGGYIKKQLE